MNHRMLFFYWVICFWIGSFPLYADSKLPEMHHRSDLILPKDMLKPTTLWFENTADGGQKIVCKTCHGIEGIAEMDFVEVDRDSADFLRNGPYQNMTDFCYLCHQRQENQRPNIHILLTENDERKDQQCLYCHQELPQRDDERPPLRLSTEKLCHGCHLRTPHLNALEHQKRVEKEMQKYMQQRSEKTAVKLPLGDNNQITCVTCHDPHQQGVFKQAQLEAEYQVGSDLKQGISYSEHPWETVYAADKQQRLQQLDRSIKLQYQRIEYEVLLRLPAKNGALCLACHDFSKERKW